MTRVCTKCGRELPLDDFHRNKVGKYGRTARCKSCCREYDQKRYRQFPEKRKAAARRSQAKHRIKIGPEEARRKYRDQNLRHHYGISSVQYDQLCAQQNHVCAICGLPPGDQIGGLYVDHDHITGKVRGLLCNVCNSGLGCFKDDIRLFNRAITYLNEEN